MLALWSCGRRSSVVQAQRQIHRVLLAVCPLLYQIRGSSPLRTAALMPSEPHIRVSERCDDFCFGLQPDLVTEPRRVGQLPGRGRRSRRIRHDAVFQPRDADHSRLWRIVPLDPFARSLSNLESVLGPFYLAITVARLVTLEVEDRRR